MRKTKLVDANRKRRRSTSQAAFVRRHGKRAFLQFMLASHRLGVPGGGDRRTMKIADMPSDLDPNLCIQLTLKALGLQARGLAAAIKEVQALREKSRHKTQRLIM